MMHSPLMCGGDVWAAVHPHTLAQADVYQMSDIRPSSNQALIVIDDPSVTNVLCALQFSFISIIKPLVLPLQFLPQIPHS